MNSIEMMIARAEKELQGQFAEIEANEEKRTRQVLDTFRKFSVSYRHFAPTTGYGYDDIGRATLEKIYADLFHTEAALMRPHVASGTAALSLTLFGMTKPGERILCATGMPYDTLQTVIGTGNSTPPGSLKGTGVGLDGVYLKDGKSDGEADEPAAGSLCGTRRDDPRPASGRPADGRQLLRRVCLRGRTDRLRGGSVCRQPDQESGRRNRPDGRLRRRAGGRY